MSTKNKSTQKPTIGDEGKNKKEVNPETTKPLVEKEVVEDTVTTTPGTGVDLDGDGNADTILKKGEDIPAVEPELPLTETPGAGVDTDGDGDADEIVGADGIGKIHVDKTDYKTNVKLSDQPSDVVPKKDASKLVKDSNINLHYQDIMLQQIEDGQLLPPYVEAFKNVRNAVAGGSIYRPGQDGL